MNRPGWRQMGLWAGLASAAGLVAAAAFRPGHATAVPGGPVGDLLEDEPASRGPLRSKPDPNHLGHRAGAGNRQHNTEHGERGTASKRIIAGYGFWIFLLSDIIMFAAFFAAYAVLSGETAGGPAGKDLFDLKVTAVETGCLLLSSFACGVASIGAQTRRGAWFYGGMAATLVLGTVFLGLEVWEFAGLVARDAGPGRSAFLSAFFALVGCHGLHVGVGLLWLTTMMAQVWAKGYRPDILRRMLCFSLFWHALDIIWVAVFTIVYLMGSGA